MILPRRERLGPGHATGLPAVAANGPIFLADPRPAWGDGTGSVHSEVEGEGREQLRGHEKVEWI